MNNLEKLYRAAPKQNSPERLDREILRQAGVHAQGPGMAAGKKPLFGQSWMPIAASIAVFGFGILLVLRSGLIGNGEVIQIDGYPESVSNLPAGAVNDTRLEMKQPMQQKNRIASGADLVAGDNRPDDAIQNSALADVQVTTRRSVESTVGLEPQRESITLSDMPLTTDNATVGDLLVTAPVTEELDADAAAVEATDAAGIVDPELVDLLIAQSSAVETAVEPVVVEIVPVEPAVVETVGDSSAVAESSVAVLEESLADVAPQPASAVADTLAESALSVNEQARSGTTEGGTGATEFFSGVASSEAYVVAPPESGTENEPAEDYRQAGTVGAASSVPDNPQPTSRNAGRLKQNSPVRSLASGALPRQQIARKSTTRVEILTDSRSELWLYDQPRNSYTLQLATSTDAAYLVRFASNLLIDQRLIVLPVGASPGAATAAEPVTSFTLLAGEFKTFEDAQAGLKELPEGARQFGARVRNLGVLQGNGR